jgi:tRNA (adenine57-N1/adenine58-N1)-methyltransferase
MTEEIKSHRLEGLVQITHRDVYNGGFLVDGKSPEATCVFLDLPKPWEALPRLLESPIDPADPESVEKLPPLDRRQSVHLCTFSPCIEQVTRTVQELRALGWIDIDMVEVSHKKLNVLRDRIGINLLSDKGVNTSPADVSEALYRLKEVGKKTQDFHKAQFAGKGAKSEDQMDVDTPAKTADGSAIPNGEVRTEKTWMQGRLVHRSEPELKTHTSYLVFAILPPEWSEEEEAAAMAKWPCGNEGKTIGSISKEVRRKEKRDMLEAKRKKKQKDRDTRDKEQEAPSQTEQA